MLRHGDRPYRKRSAEGSCETTPNYAQAGYKRIITDKQGEEMLRQHQIVAFLVDLYTSDLLRA